MTKRSQKSRRGPPQNMQNMITVAWLFKRLGTAHTMIFCIFWGGVMTGPRPILVLFAAAKQRLHVPVVLPNPEQLLEPHGLPRPQRKRQRLHMGKWNVRESPPRMWTI
jgi:hypothetical protein